MCAATPKTALVMAWNIDAISTFDPAQVGEVVTNELLQNTCDSLADFDPARRDRDAAGRRKPDPLIEARIGRQQRRQRW